MTAYVRPSRDLPLDVRMCRCGTKTLAPDAVCPECYMAAAREKARQHRERTSIIEAMRDSVRAFGDRKYLVAAGLIHGGRK